MTFGSAPADDRARARARARDLARVRDLARDLATARDLARDLALDIDADPTGACACACALSRTLDQFHAAFDLGTVRALARDLVAVLNAVLAATPDTTSRAHRAGSVRMVPERVCRRLVATAVRVLAAVHRPRYAEEFRTEL